MQSKSSRIANVLVIGGGIVGYCCALELARSGRETTLVTPSTMHGTASWGNAGHIAVEQVEPLASMASVRALPNRLFMRDGPVSLRPDQIRAWLPFALRMLAASRPAAFERGKAALRSLLVHAMPAWERLAQDLTQEEMLRKEGHSLVWESERSAVQGRARWFAADTGQVQLRDLDRAELGRIEAMVGRKLFGGLHFNGSGHIADLGLLADQLPARFDQLGGRILHDRIVALHDGGHGRIEAVCESGTSLVPDAVVLAAGIESASLLRTLGVGVPLIAERGYHIQGDASGWPADFAPIVFEDRSLIVTRFASILRAASYVEFADPLARPDPRKWDRLEAHARALNLPIAHRHERWMGARPTLPDYLPAIGRSARHPALFYAFGHQHLGLTLGPVTGELITAAVTERSPSVDLAPFAMNRFRGA